MFVVATPSAVRLSSPKLLNRSRRSLFEQGNARLLVLSRRLSLQFTENCAYNSHVFLGLSLLRIISPIVSSFSAKTGGGTPPTPETAREPLSGARAASPEFPYRHDVSGAYPPKPWRRRANVLLSASAGLDPPPTSAIKRNRRNRPGNFRALGAQRRNSSVNGAPRSRDGHRLHRRTAHRGRLARKPLEIRARNIFTFAIRPESRPSIRARLQRI